jgi:hypothetical protein
VLDTEFFSSIIYILCAGGPLSPPVGMGWQVETLGVTKSGGYMAKKAAKKAAKKTAKKR